MSDLNLLLYKDKRLHTPTELVNSIDDSIFELSGKMLGSMKLSHGIGLSANQVGVMKRICVVSLEDGTRDMALINPQIVKRSKEKVLMYEGCLSAPKVYPPVKRHKEITVKFTNLGGVDQELVLKDIDARIVQHEVDHLDGKMIIDSFMKLNLSLGDKK